MKIGLISINAHTKSLNFACPIHSWAFQQFLAKHGIESTIIDYIPNYNDNFPARDPVPYYEKKYKEQLKKKADTDEEREENEKKLKKYKEKLDGYTALREERITRFDKFQKFIDDNYVMTDTTYNEQLLEGEDPEFDCYICVTDVIWSCDAYWGFDAGFFLDCGVMDNKWKIAYAASRGVPRPHTPEQKEYFFRALSDFDYLGVREESLKDYINENLPGEPAVTVLDPVLLLQAEDYEKIMVKPDVTGYVVLYYAMEKPKELLRVALKYAKRHNYKLVELTHIPIPGGLVESAEVEVLYPFDIGPGEWLGYLKYAECIFTNSFHATCFSILFHKNFFTGKRNGDKLTHVLDLFGLDDRRIAVNKDSESVIDFAPVEERLREEREKSSDFILSAIHTLENKELPHKDKNFYKKSICYPVAYNSGRSGCVYIGKEPQEGRLPKQLASGHLEYRSDAELIKNDGSGRLQPLMYKLEGCRFAGWNLRIRIRSSWFWVKKDGTLAAKGVYNPALHKSETLFEDGALLPYISARSIASMVAEGVWERKNSLKDRLFNRVRMYRKRKGEKNGKEKQEP